MAQALKTKKEIKAKITSEKKTRKTLPEYFPAFDSNNWKTIDDNVEALQWVLDNYDLESVKDRIDDTYDQLDESDPDFSDSDYEEMNNAVAPYEWAIGDQEDF